MLEHHVDGFARALMNLPERLVIPVPGGVSERDAACAPIAFSTPATHAVRQCETAGETVLVHAGGSGIGTVAIMMAKKIGCTVITTVGDDSKIDGVKALGTDHDTEVPIDNVATALKRMESRQVFGKIVVYF
jgi:alcohol dehydrogenase